MRAVIDLDITVNSVRHVKSLQNGATVTSDRYRVKNTHRAVSDFPAASFNVRHSSTCCYCCQGTSWSCRPKCVPLHSTSCLLSTLHCPSRLPAALAAPEKHNGRLDERVDVISAALQHPGHRASQPWYTGAAAVLLQLSLCPCSAVASFSACAASGAMSDMVLPIVWLVPSAIYVTSHMLMLAFLQHGPWGPRMSPQTQLTYAGPAACS